MPATSDSIQPIFSNFRLIQNKLRNKLGIQNKNVFVKHKCQWLRFLSVAIFKKYLPIHSVKDGK
jgi:hypothetical protein